MFKKRILIRADGGPKLGLGHLIRTFSLARMLDSFFEIHFFCKEVPNDFILDLSIYNYRLHKIESEDVFLQEICKSDIIIIDHYDIGIQLQKSIRNKGAKLICIDDVHDKFFDADLIINHAPGIKISDYKAKDYTEFALGPDYALLRPEFLDAAKHNRFRKPNRNLLICFGGSDFNNLTCKAIYSLRLNTFFDEIYIVTGSAFLYKTQLLNLINRENKFHHFENQDASQILYLMNKCFFVLAPASSIAFELLAAGCRWLGGYYVENQKYIYEGFKELNCMVDLGDMNFTLHQFFSKNFHNETFESKINIPIDGNSDIRFKLIFQNLC